MEHSIGVIIPKGHHEDITVSLGPHYLMASLSLGVIIDEGYQSGGVPIPWLTLQLGL